MVFGVHYSNVPLLFMLKVSSLLRESMETIVYVTYYLCRYDVDTFTGQFCINEKTFLFGSQIYFIPWKTHLTILEKKLS